MKIKIDPLVCGICGRKYRTYEGLRKHVLGAHDVPN